MAELEKLKKDTAASGADENLNPPAPLDVPAPKYGDSDISGFVESLLTQEEALKASHGRRLEILNAANQEQLAALGGFEDSSGSAFRNSFRKNYNSSSLTPG